MEPKSPRSRRATKKYGSDSLTPRRSRRLSGLSPSRVNTSPVRRRIQRPSSSVDRKKTWDHLDTAEQAEAVDAEREAKAPAAEDLVEADSDRESKAEEVETSEDSSSPAASSSWPKIVMTNVDFRVLGALFLVFDLYFVSFLRVAGLIDLQIPWAGLDSNFHPYTTACLSALLFVVCNVVTQPWLKNLADKGVTIGSKDDSTVAEMSVLGWHVVHSVLILGLLGNYFVDGATVADMPSVLGSLSLGFYVAQCLSNCWRTAGGARNWMTLAVVIAFAMWGKTVDVVVCLVIKSFLSLAMAKWCEPVGSPKWTYYDLCLTMFVLHVAAWGSCEQALLSVAGGGGAGVTDAADEVMAHTEAAKEVVRERVDETVATEDT